MCRSSLHGNREVPRLAGGGLSHRPASGRRGAVNGREKSDSAIVAGKPTNKAGQPAAEPVEPRAEAKGNASEQRTRRTQSRVSVSLALERIRPTVTEKRFAVTQPRWDAYARMRRVRI